MCELAGAGFTARVVQVWAAHSSAARNAVRNAAPAVALCAVVLTGMPSDASRSMARSMMGVGHVH